MKGQQQVSALFRIVRGEFEGIAIYFDGKEPLTVDKTHPNYQTIYDHLTTGVDNDDLLLGLVAPGVAAAAKMSVLSERIRYDRGRIYFDGDKLDNAITAHIVRIVEDGGDQDHYGPLVNFLEKLSTNPSEESKKHLYHFVSANRMTIAPDGDLIAYKGVNADYTSKSRGFGIVNGEVFGAYDEETNTVTEMAALDNSIGNVVEIPRSMVDPNRGVACSTGLHVGAYSYAQGFAGYSGKLLTVKVNPRDVVAVPSDSNDQKVRVVRYLVLENNEGEYSGPTYFKASLSEPVIEPKPEVGEPDPEVEEALSQIEDDEESYDHEFSEAAYDEPDEDDEEEDSDEVAERFASTQPILGVVLPKDDDSEASDEEVYANKKIAEFEKLIPKLIKDKTPLRRHRNKNVTAKGRPFFDQAMTNLGLSYDK